jgi:hypothetical protein
MNNLSLISFWSPLVLFNKVPSIYKNNATTETHPQQQGPIWYPESPWLQLLVVHGLRQSPQSNPEYQHGEPTIRNERVFTTLVSSSWHALPVGHAAAVASQLFLSDHQGLLSYFSNGETLREEMLKFLVEGSCMWLAVFQIPRIPPIHDHQQNLAGLRASKTLHVQPLKTVPLENSALSFKSQTKQNS